MDQAGAAIGPMASGATPGGVQLAAARDAGLIGRNASRNVKRARSRTVERRRQPLHVFDDRADLRRVEHVVPVGHRAGVQPVCHHRYQVVIRGRLIGGGGLVLELTEREVARSRCERGGRGSVPTPIGTMAHRAAPRIDPLAERRLGRDLGARRPRQVDVRRRIRLPDRDRVCVADSREQRAPSIEREQQKEREENDAAARCEEVHARTLAPRRCRA